MLKIENLVGRDEYFHRDFPLLVECFTQTKDKKPIILRGDSKSGKKTMANQLGKIIGQEPVVFDFSNSRINDIEYMDQNLLIDKLRRKESEGAFIVIKDIDKLELYDAIILTKYLHTIKDEKNPKSTILILENSSKRSFDQITFNIKRVCSIVEIGKDPVIEEKIRKAEEEKKAKQKTMKGVNN